MRLWSWTNLTTETRYHQCYRTTKTYSPVTDKRRNPTSSTANSLQKKLAELKRSGKLTEKEYFKIKPNDPVAAFYGLPKIHKVQLTAKEDHFTLTTPSTPIPLRPINSCIGSPTYYLSKHLADLLKSLLSVSGHTVKNASEFTEFFQTQTVDPGEEIVWFDVVSLFTFIPVDLPFKVTTENLEAHPSWQENTSLTKDQVIDLTKLVLNNSYFSYEGTIYHQTFGCAMGSPVSAVLADHVMEYVETKTLSTFHTAPRWWRRYVDDSKACIKSQDLCDFHRHLNAVNPHI